MNQQKKSIKLMAMVGSMLLASQASADKVAVALGDSFISGEGAGDYMLVEGNPRPEWPGDKLDPYYCHRSANASIFQADLPTIERRFNLACSGAQPQHFMQTGHRNTLPQIDALEDIALEHDVELILIGIGSNNREFTFGGVVANCISGFFKEGMFPGILANGDPCTPLAEHPQSQFDNVISETVEIVGQVITRMSMVGYHPGDYQIVIQDYTNPISRNFAPSLKSENGKFDLQDLFRGLVNERYRHGCPIHEKSSRHGHDFSEKLGGMVETIGAEVSGMYPEQDIVYLNVQQALNGGSLCETEQHPYDYALFTPFRVKTFSEEIALEEITLIPGLIVKTTLQECEKDDTPQRCQESLHPNAAGHEILGRCLSDAFTSATTRVMSCHRNPNTEEVSTVSHLPYIEIDANPQNSYAVQGQFVHPRVNLFYDAKVLFRGLPVESWKVTPVANRWVNITQTDNSSPSGQITAVFPSFMTEVTLAMDVEAVVDGQILRGGYTYSFDFNNPPPGEEVPQP